MNGYTVEPICAAAFSHHPDAAVAVGEVVGGVLERLDPHPDLAVLLVSGPMVEHLEQIVVAVRSLLAPVTLVGSTAAGVFNGPQDGNGGAGLALWAANGAGILPLRLTVDRLGEPIGLPEPIVPGAVVVVLGAPSFPMHRLADRLVDVPPGLRLVGISADHRHRSRSPRLIGDHRLHTDGAVGVVLPPGLAQVFDFEVRTWHDGDPPPDPPIHLSRGTGALVFAERGVALSERGSLDLEVLYDRCRAAMAGAVGQTVWFPPTHRRADPGRRVVAVVFG